MSKDQLLKSQSKLPLILIILGIPNAVIIPFLIVQIPALFRPYAMKNTTNYADYSFALLFFAIMLAQIIYGIALRKQQKKGKALTNRQSFFCKVFLAISILAIIQEASAVGVILFSFTLFLI